MELQTRLAIESNTPTRNRRVNQVTAERRETAKMKRKLKQAPSVFIGLTDQDDLLVTVLVETGEVCLEYVGKKPHYVLAKNLSEFIASLAV